MAPLTRCLFGPGVARVTGGAGEAGADAVSVAGGAPAAAGVVPRHRSRPARVRYLPDGPDQQQHTGNRPSYVPRIGPEPELGTDDLMRVEPADAAGRLDATGIAKSSQVAGQLCDKRGIPI
jgi:hypothetical protein